MRVNLQWDAVNTEDVQGYVAVPRDIPDMWPVPVAQLHSRAATSFVDTTLKPGDRPTYYVRAIAGASRVRLRGRPPTTPPFCL